MEAGIEMTSSDEAEMQRRAFTLCWTAIGQFNDDVELMGCQGSLCSWGCPCILCNGEFHKASSKLFTKKQKAVFETGREEIITSFERKPLGSWKETGKDQKGRIGVSTKPIKRSLWLFHWIGLLNLELTTLVDYYNIKFTLLSFFILFFFLI